MALALYTTFLLGSCAIALSDWRRAWLLVMVCGILQDPVRKLTPGSPVWISFLVVLLYGVILFGARRELQYYAQEFMRRFRSISTGIVIFVLLLFLAALNGLMTYGFDKWKAPLVSFITYVVPMLAALFGYAWADSEERLLRWFRLYAILTSIALLGTVAEYIRIQSPILGMVSFQGDYIRHFTGIQIRMLSGIYRSPDVMSWHAGMLTSIGLAMVLRIGMRKQALLWASVAGWGFFNSLIAGRRKAVYFVIAFSLAFLWRYVRRVQPSQILATLGLLLMLGLVVRQLSSDETTSVYTATALASRGELGQRLEGGALTTFEQFGLMGAGLGTATQGVQHVLGDTKGVGWQEGGLGKIAMEVGLPGLLAILTIGFVALRLLLVLTKHPDVRGSSQFLRALLFGLVAANLGAFMGSAQAYTDAMLALTTGFLIGALFASAALDERLLERERRATEQARQAAERARRDTERHPPPVPLTPQPSTL